MGPEEMRGMPPQLLADVRELVWVARELLGETGREPTPTELAARLGKPVDDVVFLLTIAKDGTTLQADLP